MKVFVLQKQGVYAHGIFSIRTDLKLSMQDADSCAVNDRDSYHSWDVYEVDIDQLAPMELGDNKYQDSEGFMDGDVVYSTRKKDASDGTDICKAIC